MTTEKGNVNQDGDGVDKGGEEERAIMTQPLASLVTVLYVQAKYEAGA